MVIKLTALAFSGILSVPVVNHSHTKENVKQWRGGKAKTLLPLKDLLNILVLMMESYQSPQFTWKGSMEKGFLSSKPLSRKSIFI